MKTTNLLTIILGFTVILGGIALTPHSPVAGIYTVALGAVGVILGLIREGKSDQNH